jgi:hypothetical protein
MSNYPSYGLTLDSDIKPESEFEDDFSQSGIQHSRQFRSQTYYELDLVHVLTLAQFNTLTAFYEAEPRAEHTVVYHVESPAVTYTAKFTGKPHISRNLGGDKFKVVSPMRGTKN